MSRHEMDMTTGPMTKKMIIFTIPVILTGVLQLLYNAADVVVVGRFAGSQALAAVGCTGALTHLILTLFIGLSMGTNVVVAQYYGAKEEREVADTVHTSVAVGLLTGVFVAIVGFLVATPALRAMGSPEDVIDKASLYLRICFVGAPAIIVYNFGSAVLRAVGDTKRPLYFLIFTGAVNVALNLLFVIKLGLGVSGVAWPTVISQYLSAILVVICLMREKTCYRLEWRRLHIYKSKLLRLMRLGIPAGLQGAVFSFSNVIIQSAVNSFGSTTMAGYTASGNLDGFIYIAMNSLNQTAVAFTGQNVGAKKYENISKVLRLSLIMVCVVGAILGGLGALLPKQLMSIYSSDPEVIRIGAERLVLIAATYFTCGIMDVFSGTLRGMGCAMIPMFVSLAGACGTRIIWIYTVFAANHSMFILNLSYPVSWTITDIAYVVAYILVRRYFKTRWTPLPDAPREAAHV